MCVVLSCLVAAVLQHVGSRGSPQSFGDSAPRLQPSDSLFKPAFPDLLLLSGLRATLCGRRP